MGETARSHWEAVYATRPDDGVSWFQATPAPSLALLSSAGVAPGRSVIDVGGGASRLVDALLDRGVLDLTVLDISAAALERARRRLGHRAEAVAWRVGDVTSFVSEKTYDLWHDRAVFHFLTSSEARTAYKQALLSTVRPKGQAIVSTFAPDGPERCSGLAVMRYSAESLAAEFAEGWTLEETLRDVHRTPSGSLQPFTFVRLSKR
jgi:trans-aconitate methyltransferase